MFTSPNNPVKTYFQRNFQKIEGIKLISSDDSFVITPYQDDNIQVFDITSTKKVGDNEDEEVLATYLFGVSLNRLPSWAEVATGVGRQVSVRSNFYEFQTGSGTYWWVAVPSAINAIFNFGGYNINPVRLRLHGVLGNEAYDVYVSPNRNTGPLLMWLSAENENYQAPGSPQSPGVGIPTGLTIVTEGDTYVELQWTAADLAEGYELQRALDANFTDEAVTLDIGGLTSYRDEQLRSQESYYYRVRAYGEGTSSSWTLAVNPTTTAPIPAIPNDLLLFSSDITTLAGEWTSVAFATDYEIHRSLTEDFLEYEIVQALVEEPKSTFVDTNLISGTIYYYRIRAVNDGGTSDWSPIQSFQLPYEVSQSPNNLHAIFVDAGTTLANILYWSPPLGAVTGYLVRRRVVDDGGDFTTVYFSPDNGNTIFTDENVELGKTYQYQVQSYNNQQPGGDSEILTFLANQKSIDFSIKDGSTQQPISGYVVAIFSDIASKATGEQLTNSNATDVVTFIRVRGGVNIPFTPIVDNQLGYTIIIIPADNPLDEAEEYQVSIEDTIDSNNQPFPDTSITYTTLTGLIPYNVRLSASSVAENYTGKVGDLQADGGGNMTFTVDSGIDEALFSIQNGDELHLDTAVIYDNWRDITGVPIDVLEQYTNVQLEAKRLYVNIIATNSGGSSVPFPISINILPSS